MIDQNQFKIVMLGNSGVGKTALVERISNNDFNDAHVPTVGAQYVSLDIDVDFKKVTLEIWDTAGQEVFRSLVGFYARDAKGALLVADITCSTTMEDLQRWMDFIGEQAPEAKIILFANKLDLESERVVQSSDLEEFAKKNGLTFMEGSAKTGEGVDDAFSRMAEIVSQSKEQSKQNNVNVKLNEKGNDKKKKCC